VFKQFRNFHKTGNPCCGEAIDDCNEQTNAQFAHIKKPSPSTIKEFSDNLDLYREVDRKLEDLFGAPKKRCTKVMKMTESVDLLVNVFKRSFGDSKHAVTTARTVSVMADGYGGASFKDDLAGSSALFQGTGSPSALKRYVLEKLKRKDGLFDPNDGKPPSNPTVAEDGEEGVQGGIESDSESSDDDVPLPQALKTKRSSWLKNNKPRSGESLENYQHRIGMILQGGVKGNGNMVAALNSTETYQLAAQQHDTVAQAAGTFVHKMNKILAEKLVGSDTHYLVRYTKHRNQPAKLDEWLPENKLRNGPTMIAAYKTDGQIAAGEVHEVEYIYDKRMQNGVMEYHVKWRGYAKHKDYWEKAANLKGSEGAITDFIANSAPLAKKQKKKRSKKPASSASDADY